MRAKAKVITAISARSRRPTSVDTLSSSSRACSPVSTVVLPVLTTCFGEVLLDGGLLEVLAEPSDVGRDVHRLDVGEFLDILAPIAPGPGSAKFYPAFPSPRDK